MSLSAILLDDDYFKALQAAKRQMDGLTIADETILIPYKARAFLNLTGEGKGDSADTKKTPQRRISAASAIAWRCRN
jgi:hypothetical protein